ncbi:TonB-dependent receptor [Phenylobacterium deserti]|nr:TonB-dependent receptor [Phenylobacterium deserti]
MNLGRKAMSEPEALPTILMAGCLVAAALATSASAQTTPSGQPQAEEPAAPAGGGAVGTDEEGYEVDELVVTAASAQIGTVPGNIPPEIQLGPREIRALGVSSVAELLEALAPQVSSGRGRGGERPIILVNAARISSFSEIRDLPPEAILRVDILPEEVALQYGYRADQRVVNIVLRPRFRALTTEVGARVATAGGREAFDVNANALRIQRDNRFQLDVKASTSDPLFENERNIIQNVSGRPYDTIGNVTASPFGGEIDPALSALAGQPLTVAPLPTSLTGAPTLGAFAAGGVARTSDVGGYRTLLSGSDQLSINAVLTRALGGGTSATVNGRFEKTEGESQLGLPTTALTVPAGNPFSPFSGPVEISRYVGDRALLRRSDSETAHLGFAANGARSGWRWAFTANADRSNAKSLTDAGLNTTLLQAAIDAGDPAVNPFAPLGGALLLSRPADWSKSTITTADAELVVNGSLFELPAGALNTSLTVGGETNKYDSESFRSGVQRSVELSRDVGSVQASFDLPITSRRNDFLAAAGDLSVNVNLAAERLSDFGTLTTVGGGVNWSPIAPVRLIASFTEEEGPPTIQQLGDPEVATPAVRVFDFIRGETVEVTQITGGNPALNSDNRRVIKLGLNIKPFSQQQLTFRADYTKTRIEDAIASFPTATAEIEAAFPERFVRNAEGRLIQIDSRPVNFERQEREELRWGFNYSRPLGPQRPPGGWRGQGGARPGAAAGQPGQPGAQQAAAGAPGAASQAPGGAPAGAPPEGAPPREGAGARQGGDGARGPGGFGPGGPGGPGGFGGFGGGRGGRGGGALQFGVFHTVHLKEEIVIRPGVPVLDLLNGSAAGSTGGQPEHEVEVQLGFSKNGLGARVTAEWQSGTEVFGVAGGQDLKFSDLTTVNLRLFADLGLQPIARQHRWLRGARVTASINNLFDERLDVRTSTGETPVSYQPYILDPLGRTVRVSFRKLFF